MNIPKIVAFGLLVALGVCDYLLIESSFEHRKDLARGQDPWDLDYGVRMLDRRNYTDSGKRFHTAMIVLDIAIFAVLGYLLFW